MDCTKAIDALKTAEDELLCLISSDCSYDKKQTLLMYSRSVHNLVNGIEGMGRSLDAAPDSVAFEGESSSLPESEARKDGSADFPAYFVYVDKLWKVAKRSGESDALYRKSVPYADVRIVCSTVHSILGGFDSFTTADVEKQMESVPAYKIQITIMALVQAGVLVSAGRGKYSLVAGSSSSDRKWLDALKALPVRADLVK